MNLKVTNGSYSLTTNTRMKICESKIILHVDNNEISCLENAEQKSSELSYEAILYNGRLKVKTEFQTANKLLVTKNRKSLRRTYNYKQMLYYEIRN